MVGVSGADQREIAFIGNGEEDAPVGKLEEIGIIMVEQLAHDDMRSAHQPHLIVGRRGGAMKHVEHRRPRGEIGRASCRERVCQWVDLGGRRSIKKKKYRQKRMYATHKEQ